MEDLQDFIRRKLSDVESNWSRFPERSADALQAAMKRLEEEEAKGEIDASFLAEQRSILEEWQVKLRVLQARNARDRDVLEYGLDYHLDRFVPQLEKGPPGDPRFPDRDEDWVKQRTEEKDRLERWFEAFNAEFDGVPAAKETHHQVHDALKLYKKKMAAVRVPMLVKKARNARRADGSVLEYGLEYHLNGFTNALEKGIPGDPRFPERDTQWIEERAKDQKLLVEWLEGFKSELGEYDEAKETIEQCEKALKLYRDVVDAARAPLLVQQARNARRADGSCLEYGLEYHLRNFLGALEKGCPGDPRFPERDQEWVTKRKEENSLLMEWLEGFKSELGHLEQAQDTIQECEKALAECKKALSAVEGPLLVRSARNARRADGSCLEYGLEYHLRGFNGALEKGIPGDPRFPERDSEWLTQRAAEKELLVQWLEGFKSDYGGYAEAADTLQECEAALKQYTSVVGPLLAPLLIQKARNARRADGSCLEYGLEYHLRNFIAALEKGIPGDPRFPERDTTWVNERVAERDLLVQWLEGFKSEVGEYAEAAETIRECEAALDLYKNVVDKVRVPLMVQQARNARRADGSCLEYGLEYHLRNFIAALEKGIPGDPRFPERDHQWVDERIAERDLIVQWLEGFKSELGGYKEAQETIDSVESALALCRKIMEKERIPLLVQKAVNARRADGSCLEYGLDYHLRGMNSALEKGLPGDPRFPERDTEWIAQQQAQKDLLVQWLEGFKSDFEAYKEAQPYIEQCEEALTIYRLVVDAVRVPLLVRKARGARRDDGSCLEYGLDHHMEGLSGLLDKGAPRDPRFPERDNEWVQDCNKRKELLVEWLEGFKSQLSEYEEAQATIQECEALINRTDQTVGVLMIPLRIQNARNARRAEGSVLEYGLEKHLETMKSQLESGPPGDPRFPDRDDEWMKNQTAAKELLVEWLENFKSEFGALTEAATTWEECEAVLSVYNQKVGAVQIPLQIQAARNARREQGSCLEYGLEYHMKGLLNALEKGLPADPRFPERDQEWLAERTKERDLLMQWLEGFKANFQEYAEAQATVEEVEAALNTYRTVTDPYRVPLLIQTARHRRKADGSCLEYGLDYHLSQLRDTLNKGIPGDTRFPERDHEWVKQQAQRKDSVVEWLEDFKAQLGHYSEAADTIRECEDVLGLYDRVIIPLQVPLDIQAAVNARRQDGSALEYGLEYEMNKLKNSLDAGKPEGTAVKVDEWLRQCTTSRDALVIWLEDFKSRFATYSEAQPVIDRVEALLDRYRKEISALTIPRAIQHAREARKAQGSCLEYGLASHLESLSGRLDKGMPNDPRFPERDREWLEQVTQQRSLLLDWLEDFRSQYETYKEAEETIKECEALLTRTQDVLEPLRTPLLLKEARLARNILPYGLDYHLERLNGALEKGLPNDTRFPERDVLWMEERSREKDLLVQWLEDFRASFAAEAAAEIVAECEKALTQYQSVVGPLYLPVQIQQELGQRDPISGVDFITQTLQLSRALDSGIPNDPRFPERDNEYLAARKREYAQLLDRTEELKAKYGDQEAAAEAIASAEKALEQCRALMSSTAIPVAVKNARNARRAQGSVLEYGLDYHLRQMETELKRPLSSMDLPTLRAQYQVLLEWLEAFKANFLEQIMTSHADVMEVINLVEGVVRSYKETVAVVTVPLAVEQARASRKLLSYGLDYHLRRFTTILEAERDCLRTDEATAMYNQLLEWLESFKAEFKDSLDVPVVGETIKEAEALLRRYTAVISGARLARAMADAVTSREILPYGLDYQIQQLENFIGSKQGGKAVRDAAGLLLVWMENFRATFQFVEGADAILARAERVMEDFKKTFPHEAAQQLKEHQTRKQTTTAQTTRGGAVTAGGDADTEEDEIPQEQTSSVLEGPQEPTARGTRSPLVPAPEEQAPRDEGIMDRDVPSKLAKGDSYKSEVMKKQSNLQENVGKPILLTVDWEFINSPAFEALGEEEQQKICQNLVFGLLSRTILADTGYSGLIQKSKLASSRMVSPVSVIVVSYLDQNTPLSASLEDGFLYLRLGQSLWKDALEASVVEETLRELFRLSYYETLAKLESQTESVGNALQKNLQREKSPILVQADVSFVSSAPFLAMSPAEQLAAIERLGIYAKALLLSGGGLSDLCEKSSTMKRVVFGALSQVHIRYDLEASSEYTLDFNKETGALELVVPFKNTSVALPDLNDAFDLAFGLVALKAKDAARNKLVAYKNIIARKIKADVIVQIDWDAWMTHPTFLDMPVPAQTAANQALLNTHLNEIINGSEGLTELFHAQPALRPVLLRKLKLIRIAYDPTNSVKSPSKEHPFFELKFDHYHCTLTIVGNLSAAQNKHGWKDFASKALPIFESAAFRFHYDAQLHKLHRSDIYPMVGGTDLRVRVDWDSFVNDQSFLTRPSAQRQAIMKAYQSIHVPNLMEQLKRVCEHPLGQKAVQEQVRTFLITTRPISVSSSTGPRRGNHYALDEEDKCFRIVVPVQWGDKCAKLQAWQIRWCLGVSVDIAQDIGQKKMEAHRTSACQTVGKDIALTFDWSFLNTETFKNFEPLHMVTTIEQLSDALIYRLYHRGLVAVCEHPIGKQNIQEHLRTVSVTYSPESGEGSMSQLKKEGDELKLRVAANQLEEAVQSRYKERIEFEYDLIVAIAKDNAMAAFNAVQEQLNEHVNGSVPIQVEIDNFTQLDGFRHLPAPEQADIITILFSRLPQHAIANASTGLLAAIPTQSLRQQFVKQVQQLTLAVDPQNGQVAEGDLSLNGGTLRLLLNLKDVLGVLKIANWKERFAVVLGNLKELACYETEDERASIEKKLRSSLNNSSFVVDVNWEELEASDNYKSLRPTDREQLLKYCNTTMLHDTLLGDSGFTGAKGLCQYEETVQHLNQHLKAAQFFVLTSQGTNRPYLSVNSSSQTMEIAYAIADVRKKKFEGCHAALEQELSLRDIKQPAAIKRADQVIANDTGSLPLTCEMLWDSFVSSLQASEYVRVIEEVATMPKRILMGSMRSFGNVGVSALLSQAPALQQKIGGFKKIQISLDASNQVQVNLGKSHTLNPVIFKVSTSGDAIVVRSNLKERECHCGCARAIHFELCSGEAHQQEEQEISETAAYMLAQEQEHRADSIRRAQERNQEITRQNARDQEDYQRKMQEYQQKVNERCNYSQCQAGYSKCGVCNGRGHNTNNNNTRTCSSCGGQGRRPCSHCNGTQKKYPSGLSMPSVPSARSMESIPTFGPLPNYRKQI